LKLYIVLYNRLVRDGGVEPQWAPPGQI